jgi:HlyD family secretion protein
MLTWRRKNSQPRSDAMNKKIALPALIGVIVVVAVVVWGWRAFGSTSDDNQLTLYGNVDIHQVALAFNASERITQLNAREGDRVRAGEVLGRLDDRTAKLRLAQTEAQIGVQEQILQRLRTGSRPEEIGQATANVAAAEAEAEQATRQVARLKAISEATAGKGVSGLDMDAALTRQKVALAQLDSARKSAQLVIVGPRKEDIAQAEKQLAFAQAEQALIERQLDESQLLAPTEAVVRARLLEPGEMASPQRPVFTLAITQPKWVRTYVAEPILGRVRTGMAASVSTDSHPEQIIPAKLGYISSVAEFTPKTVQTEDLRTSLVYEVRFMVDDPQDRLRLGMPATVKLKLDPPEFSKAPAKAANP